MFTFLEKSNRMKKKESLKDDKIDYNQDSLRILIIGATSAIASACARKWTEKKAHFFLVGRNPEKLQLVSQDLIARGSSKVTTHILDLNQFDDHDSMLNACYKALGQIDIALIAHGSLPHQKACEQDANLALKEFSSNGLSVISLLTLLANRMEAHHSGAIAVISSVAGDRGRASNYLYGTAKAAVSTFCEGLRGRLFQAGVHVLTIKPGFVDTPMTQRLPLPKLLVATPEKVANDIVKAINARKNTIYTPSFWMIIMWAMKRIPSSIFKNLKI
jgi:decaprenylphospho-beta-D-erythro-pentofuranosid-2-ulose 2-reductase